MKSLRTILIAEVNWPSDKLKELNDHLGNLNKTHNDIAKEMGTSPTVLSSVIQRHKSKLPNATIVRKRRTIGSDVKKEPLRRKKWSTDEVQQLKSLTSDPDHNLHDVSSKLGRTYHSTRTVLRRIVGIKRSELPKPEKQPKPVTDQQQQNKPKKLRAIYKTAIGPKKPVIRSARDWPEARLAELDKHLEDPSNSHKHIARKMDIPTRSVYYAINKYKSKLKNADVARVGTGKVFKYTPEQIDKFKEMIRKGHDYYKIADHFGQEPHNMKRLAAQLKADGHVLERPKIRFRTWSDSQIEKFKKLKVSKTPKSQIASILGKSPQAINSLSQRLLQKGEITRSVRSGRQRVPLKPEHIEYAKQLRTRAYKAKTGTLVNTGAKRIADKINDKFGTSFDKIDITKKIKDGTI